MPDTARPSAEYVGAWHTTPHAAVSRLAKPKVKTWLVVWWVVGGVYKADKQASKTSPCVCGVWCVVCIE